ncbi:UNVERIFIED_CONTAM: hypothetical protein FKN15_004645 [Acipenser sinensis]
MAHCHMISVAQCAHCFVARMLFYGNIRNFIPDKTVTMADAAGRVFIAGSSIQSLVDGVSSLTRLVQSLVEPRTSGVQQPAVQHAIASPLVQVQLSDDRQRPSSESPLPRMQIGERPEPNFSPEPDEHESPSKETLSFLSSTNSLTHQINLENDVQQLEQPVLPNTFITVNLPLVNRSPESVIAELCSSVLADGVQNVKILDYRGRRDWTGDPVVEKIAENISFLGQVNDAQKKDFTQAAARYYTSVVNRAQIEAFKEGLEIFGIATLIRKHPGQSIYNV